MATEVNRMRENMSGSFSSNGSSSKNEMWLVITTDYTEPETVIGASGLPTKGALLSGTTMRVTEVSPEFVNIAKNGSYVWHVGVKYQTPNGQSNEIEPVNGTELWTITTQMQSGIVKQCRSQKKATDSPDVGLLVGVKDDGTIEGGDWGYPVTTLSITLYKSKAAITESYITTAVKDIGKVNSGSWYGFDAGEVRFEGMSIPSKLESLWELQFDFAIKENEAQADLPTYDGVSGTIEYPDNVAGWEYPWLKEIEKINDAEDDKEIVVEGVYIARFYKTSSFSSLGLSGSLF